MKYILFTYEGQGYPLAQHLIHEGQEVFMAVVQDEYNTLTKIEKRKYQDEEPFWKKRRLSLFKNIFERIPADEMIKKMKKIKNPEEYFVFFDSNDLFLYADQVKDLGFHGNFPSERDRLFEIDRDEAKEFVKKYYHEVNFTEKKEFRTVGGARKFLKDVNSHRIWVLKGKNYDAQTFIPTTNNVELAKKQIIETLEAFKENYEEGGFILEEKIPNIIELTPEKIYYDGVPLCMTINFENKPVGSGNISLQTGCAADLVFPVSLNNKIHEIAFPPIVDKLAKKHKGLFIWDASLLINSQTGKVFFGEFCSNRVGYNSFFTELCQLPSIHDFFESVVEKKNPFTLGTVGTSVRLFNLYRDLHERHILSGISIDYPDEIQQDVWLWDIYKRNRNAKMKTVGYQWDLCIITGTGNNINEAVKKLYRNVEKFSLAGVYYRPQSDYLSKEYPTSIMNRLNYCLKNKLFDSPF